MPLRTCPSCGKENPSEARFCMACSAALETEVTPPRELRKTVTVVFSDLSGSTRLGEQLDPETLRRVMGRYFEAMRRILERHGGTVEKFIGDAVMSVFGIPQVHEDDALRAVRAASEIREALKSLDDELDRERGIRLQFRTGINTGEVVAGDPSASQTLVTGDAVNVAARLEQAAQPGEILIGESTYRLVRDAVTVEPLEPLAAKGKTGGVPRFRLLDVKTGGEGFSRNLDSPLVGRERERASLQQAFDRTTSDSACHLFTLMGPAGAGKSRLVAEFLHLVEDQATILQGRCLPYGEGITFWPVREVVKAAVSSPETDSPAEAHARISAALEGEPDAATISARIASAIGLTESGGAVEEIFWAFRKLLEKLAESRPLVVVFDDIHWADPTFLDLIEHVADLSRDSPILLLCPGRPELLEVRPGWGGGKINASSILLEPLSEAESALLIENLLGHARLAPEVQTRISEAAEGNPLFVEEMLRMLIDDGLLSRQNGHWVPAGDLSKVPVPPTTRALLAARLDRLEGEERRVIERAAVGGKVFYRGAVAELSPEPVRPEIGKHLVTLARRELIRGDRSSFAGQEAFRFRHILIRDAAYDAMPKEARADLHERFAGWLEKAAGESAAEYEEILGYHLEQAYRYRIELGPEDDAAQSVARRAFERLERAGRRAYQRGDMAASANLFSRAVNLLPVDDLSRLQLLPELGRALYEGGTFEEAESVLTEAIERGRTAGEVLIEARGRILLLRLRMGTSTKGWVQEARETVQALLPILESKEDDRGLAEAWALMAWTQNNECRYADMAASAESILKHAGRAGDLALQERAHGLLIGSLGWGPTPVNEAAPRIRQITNQLAGHRQIEGQATGWLGVFAAQRGDFEEARVQVRRALGIEEDLGLALIRASHEGQLAGRVEELAGDWAAAEQYLRRSHDQLEQMGEQAFRSTVAGILARVLWELGNDDEALYFADVSRDAAASDDILSQALWRAARAKVLARRGQHEEAESLAQQAVALMATTDSLDWHGTAQMDLAAVLRLGGKRQEAIEASRQALALFKQKGNLVMAERAGQLIDQLDKG